MRGDDGDSEREEVGRKTPLYHERAQFISRFNFQEDYHNINPYPTPITSASVNMEAKTAHLNLPPCYAPTHWGWANSWHHKRLTRPLWTTEAAKVILQAPQHHFHLRLIWGKHDGYRFLINKPIHFDRKKWSKPPRPCISRDAVMRRVGNDHRPSSIDEGIATTRRGERFEESFDKTPTIIVKSPKCPSLRTPSYYHDRNNNIELSLLWYHHNEQVRGKISIIFVRWLYTMQHARNNQQFKYENWWWSNCCCQYAVPEDVKFSQCKFRKYKFIIISTSSCIIKCQWWWIQQFTEISECWTIDPSSTTIYQGNIDQSSSHLLHHHPNHTWWIQSLTGVHWECNGS